MVSLKSGKAQTQELSGDPNPQYQAPKKGISIKNFARNPPPRPPSKGALDPMQILYVWGLRALENTGKSPSIKNFGGGGLRVPKILYAEILCVFYLLLTVLSQKHCPKDPAVLKYYDVLKILSPY